MDSLLAVLDIGKTNARLTVVDPDTERTIFAASRGQHTGPAGQLDVASLQDWLLDSLAACPERSRIGRIVPVAHGAACVMLGASGEILRAPDYEDAAIEAESGDYDALRDGFNETLSPALPLGLNLGRQLFHAQQRMPEMFHQVTHILLYPQFWAWFLSGVAASERTSLGCHTDLWRPAADQLSGLARRQGWDRLLPPLRQAADELGCVRPEIAARCGLDPGCRVLCGIHDSNAAYLRHRMHRRDEAPFSVVSSGTWTIVMSRPVAPAALRQERDMLGNVDAFGGIVGTARFMGGREYEAVAGHAAAQPDRAALARVLATGATVRPGLTAGGQFPGLHGAILGAETLDAPALAALATLHVAMLADNALSLLGAGGDVVVEGPLAENKLFAPIMATLRPGVKSCAPGAGTVGGALCLALGEHARPPALEATSGRIDGVTDYAARWRAAYGAWPVSNDAVLATTRASS